MSDHNKDEIMAHFGRSTPLLVERRRTKRRISIRLVLQLTVVVQGAANLLRKPNRYLSLPSCGLLLLLPVHGACLPPRWVGRRCFSLPRTLLPPPLMPRPENELVADTAELRGKMGHRARVPRFVWLVVRNSQYAAVPNRDTLAPAGQPTVWGRNFCSRWRTSRH